MTKIFDQHVIQNTVLILLPKIVSHVTFYSTIKQTTREEKITAAKVEKFSDEVTVILRKEASTKMKKLMYVFIRVDQKKPGLFSYEIDDSRDKISEDAGQLIRTAFEQTFAKPAAG